MSGKSEFVFKLLRNQSVMFDKTFDRVVYCYGEWQNAFEKLQKDVKNIEFVKGLQSVVEDEDFFDTHQQNLLIMDDLAMAVCNDPKTSKMFTQGIHHRNISVIFILQNLYKQGKAMRDITLNAQYFVIFKNVRDVNQIGVLGRQMGLPHLSEAYRKITEQAFQPVVIDMKPNTKDYLRIRSHIFPEDGFSRLYVKKDTALPCRKE
jgi:hypothetical protein